MTPESALEAYFAKFRESIIGNGQTFQSPFGEMELIYADWTATARAYCPIEDCLQNAVLPFVANTHTAATTTGTLTSIAYEKAKCIIKKHVNANEDDALLFCGSGMTAAVNKLQRILGLRVAERVGNYTKNSPFEIDETLRPVVFITRMEHHSNHITWLETIATVVLIDINADGNVDLAHLENLLKRYRHRKNKIAAVTACSNVTGIETPYHEIAGLMHRHGGLCFVDFASSAPYIDIDKHPGAGNCYLDAIYFSCHKFLGGPGTPGVLIFNKKIYSNTVPDQPGGGTVVYTNPWSDRDYDTDIERREDGGTPPILQGIKAAMCIRLKEAMGVENIRRREEEILEIIFNRFAQIQNCRLLEDRIKKRLGIISFMIKGAHYNLIVKLLNDRFGIQTRGGCSCAGTYGHQLLHVDKTRSYQVRNAIRSGDLSCKPGWVRLSIHPTMTNAEVTFIMDAIASTAANFAVWADDYSYDAKTNEYFYKGINADGKLADAWFDANTWSDVAVEYKFE